MKLNEIKILLVEDNSDHQLLAKIAVSRLDMNINLTICENGAEALKVLEKKRLCPDIALIDVDLMNDMNGFDVAARIRQLPHLSGTDIIYFTGYDSPEYEARANQTGAFDYILKHDDMSITVTRLKKVIAEWRDRRKLEPV